MLLVDRAPHGAEHLRRMLVGSLLAVTPGEVARIAGLYALVGVFHWACRRPFFLISADPDAAFRAGGGSGSGTSSSTPRLDSS